MMYPIRNRFALLAALAAGVASTAPTPLASAQQILAASFQPPNNSDAANLDPDPLLSGILRIDLATGLADPFIDVGTAGLQEPTAIAVGPRDGRIYVGSNASGQIFVFDGQTGAPIEDPTRGISGGQWLTLGDVGVAGLAFDSEGLLYASAAPALNPSQGFIARLDAEGGTRLADAISVIEAPGGMTFDANGALIAAEGAFFAPGSVVRIVDGAATPVIPKATGLLDDAQAVLRAPLAGDYLRTGRVDGFDLLVWQQQFGSSEVLAGAAADGDRSGSIDAADLEVWAGQLGAEAGLLVADFLGLSTLEEIRGNRLVRVDSDGSNLEVLAIVPPDVPSVPPPGVFLLSNFPSGLLLTEQQTIVVSALGLTNRPDNRGSLQEFDAEGNLLRTISGNLPPISAIAWAPIPFFSSIEIPEPTGFGLALWGAVLGILRRHSPDRQRRLQIPCL
jgi:hypothetical protein